MRRFLMFAGGLALGVALGVGTALLLAPVSGRRGSKIATCNSSHPKREARRASEEHKAALEAQLAEMTDGAVRPEAETEP